MTDQEKAWIAVASIRGIGRQTFQHLMEHFEDPTELLANYPKEKDSPELRHLVPEEAKEQLLKACKPDYPERLARRLEQLDIVPVTQLSPDYPERFYDMEDPPLVLYTRGDISLLNAERTIGVIGTREPTRYGEKAARSVAAELCDYGAVIVSGMARGIDSLAQEAALEAGGRTIAILGCGVDICYPQRNQKLYDEIREKGLLISEFTPKTEPLAGNFPIRNRLIANLSDALAVIEAGEKSGTSITVEYALDHGIGVYAVPGNIDSQRSVSTNRLIRDGAFPLLSVADMAESLLWDRVRAEKSVLDEETVETTPQELQVITLLRRGPHSFDEISAATGIDTPVLAGILGTMLMKGLAIQLPGRVYQLP